MAKKPRKAPAKKPGIPTWNPQMKGWAPKGAKPDKIEKKFPDSKFPPRKKGK